MNAEQSIYQQITNEREKSPVLPYTFQNPETAGREDTLYILLTDGIPFSQKEDLALECSQILHTMIHQAGEDAEKKLDAFLQKYPMRLFFIELRERLRNVVEQEQFTVSQLHTLGMELTRNRSNPEKVKLGIILLGFSLHDLTKQIFKVLGYHSDYTIYVAESLRHSHFKQNELIFDLVQHTAGYGRLAALFLLKPVTEQQRTWVLKAGTKSTFLSTIYVNVALQKADIRNHLYQMEITEDNYSDLMYILAYREPIEQKTLPDEMLNLMERAVAHRSFANQFIDQAALVMIWLQLIDSWKQDYQLLDKKMDETSPLSKYWDQRFTKYETMIRTIEVFLNKPKWKHMLLKEMAAPKETDFLIVNVLQFLEMKPEMSTFIPLMMRNPLGLNLLDLFLVHHPETYFYEVCDYLSQLLTDQLFQLPFKFVDQEEMDSSDLMKVNLWLERLLKCMLSKDLYDEEWCLQAAEYYHPKIRRLALQTLRKYVEIWENEDEVADVLEVLLEKEKNKKNVRLVHKLLNLDVEIEKDKVYLKVPHLVTNSSKNDKKLMTTHIAAMRYHDLSVVEELIEQGKILQLVRERENEHDRHAIAITLESGYRIGYVPRADNRVLATLMDNEEVLYARFESEEFDEDEATIAILLKKNILPMQEEKLTPNPNIVPFPKK